MYFNSIPDVAKRITERQFLQKTTFKDKFKVAWKLAAPYINECRDELKKTVKNYDIWKEIGNKVLLTKNNNYLKKSIDAYTKSIAYAPVGSTELSLAYENRSAVLFEARLYDDCLLDIERALKSGYPDHLKTKLFLRQSLCFKALKPNSELEPSISMANAMQWLPNLKDNYPNCNILNDYSKMIKNLEKPREILKFIPEITNANSVIVGASDAIELKKTNENKQHIVATRDIKSGEFIYLSEPFAATIGNERRFTNCWYCCRSTWSGVPCDNCPNVIYCSDVCKNKSWNSYHNIECSVLGQLLNFHVHTISIFPVKIFSRTFNSENGLIELKKKFDEIDLIKDKTLILTNDKLDVNNINNIYRLDYFQATSTECTFESALLAVLIVAIFGQKTNIFGNKMTMKNLIEIKNGKILILGELILRCIMIVERNGKLFTEMDTIPIMWSNVLIPFCKILTRSCDPHVDWTHFGSNVGYYTCKPIKQGDVITAGMVSSYHNFSKKERDIDISLFDLPPCTCTACLEHWPAGRFLPSYETKTLPARIKQELDYMALLLKEWRRIIDHGDTKQLLSIKDSLNNINDKFYQYISAPCREKSMINIYLKTLYCRLHTLDNTLE